MACSPPALGRVCETWARQYRGLRPQLLAGAAALPGMAWPNARERFPSAVAMTAYTAAGARFADGSEAAFDVIVPCTGYRPAVDPLAAHVSVDEAGPVRTDADAACA